MKNPYVVLLLTLFIISCGEKKIVELPEISQSDITEIQDVSAAYLFYDETQTDSVELNRKNLISTTNWLVNIDKRLTLKQVIPHIKYLQDKKANAGHKNENAKNYFTCHDTSKNNLGFVEFTDTDYHFDMNDLYERKGISPSSLKHEGLARIYSADSINLFYPDHEDSNVSSVIYSNKDELLNDIPKMRDSIDIVLYLSFTSPISFQDYISVQETLKNLELDGIEISNHEFIIDSL